MEEKSQRKVVFILSRGMRLANLFSEMAKSLASKHEVHVMLSCTMRDRNPEEELRVWKQVPNVILHDLKSKMAEAINVREKNSETLGSVITQIEKRLGLTLYQSASNYLLYRRFSKDYFKAWHGLYDTQEEMEQEFVGAYDFFLEAFNCHRPHAVFCEMVDLIPHRVATSLAHALGIFGVYNSFTTALGTGYGFLASGSNLWNVLLDNYYQNPDHISEASWQKANVLLTKYQRTDVPKDDYTIRVGKKMGKKEWIENLRKFPDKLRKPLLPPLYRIISRTMNQRWLNQRLLTHLPNEKYLLFYLHHQPESNTKIPAPLWVDQDRIVEQLAIKAPAGMKIVVKENAKTFGLRGKRYFGSLVDFPNVHLLHPSFDSAQAIRHATAVLAISGTVGLEALFMGKKVGVLAPIYYTLFPGVRLLSRPDQIFSELEDPSWQPELLSKELRTFAAAYVESCFFRGEPMSGSPWPDPKLGGKNYANAIDRFLENIEKYNLHPSSFPIFS